MRGQLAAKSKAALHLTSLLLFRVLPLFRLLPPRFSPPACAASLTALTWALSATNSIPQHCTAAPLHTTQLLQLRPCTPLNYCSCTLAHHSTPEKATASAAPQLLPHISHPPSPRFSYLRFFTSALYTALSHVSAL